MEALPHQDRELLQSVARELREALSKKFWRKLGGPKARIRRLTKEAVERLNARLTIPELRGFFEEYQRTSTLSLAELWAIQPMLKLELLEWIGRKQSVGDAITSLRTLEQSDWNKFIESICLVHAILLEDPEGSYARMDFDTRDSYRRAIEKMAERGKLTEEDVVRRALDQARQAGKHVGFFLGEPVRSGWSAAASHLLYFGGLTLLTAGLMWLAARFLEPAPWWVLAFLLVPLSQVALSILHPLVNRVRPPLRLPRLDFSEGVPDNCRAFVVVPTLLLSRSGVANLLERLEIHYLANRDRNLLFGLLTDLPDAPARITENDDIVEVCADGIRALNERYCSQGNGPFYLFHREREWNAGEDVWMGRERKRGKLDDFNDYLLGRGDAFEVKVGDLQRTGNVRYVITLDSDTQLPRDTARDLLGAIAHPLNRPILDASNVVRAGYALLQPRVSVSMESSRKSRLAGLYSGQTGLDPYTRAVSDVYQDLFGQASYTGKGIYDVATFASATCGRFPDNTLLSHDLIEGEHARVGLVTDAEVIDDFPTTYEAFAKRKHRWVRGDWQIAMWLLPRVPDAHWKWVRNPLSILSRWKILDNLRRSVYEISLAVFFFAGLFAVVDPWRASLTVLAVLLAPAFTHTAFSLLRVPPVRFWRAFLREAAWQLARGVAEAFVSLAFLLHQALLMADAIVRTLVRRLVTKRKLLEWESMAQSESGGSRSLSLAAIYILACPVVATLAAFLAPAETPFTPVVMLTLWAASPLSAEFISQPMRFKRSRHARDTQFLRDIALRTWRYFMDFGVPEQHWLIPDNVQQDPFAIAYRSSPTNMGLQLVASVAARDFGYLSPLELADRLENELETLEGLERSRGHFYNWYDTRTLAPLNPRTISSVDSGNLAASLIAVKQSCAEVVDAPMLGPETMAGLRDHCARLRHALPHAGRTASIMREIHAFAKQLESEQGDLFFWEGLLSELRKMGTTLAERVDWLCEHMRARKGQSLDDVCFWMRALNGRLDELVRLFHELAPWLTGPLEQEFRMLAADPQMRALMAELSRIPKLSGLPAQYEAIERESLALIQSDRLAPGTRRILEELLASLGPAHERAQQLIQKFERSASMSDRLFHEMDFRFLLDDIRKLMHVGFDVETSQVDGFHYGLLASEARTGVFVAVAKGDFPREAWFRLGRKLTSYRGHRTLLSWSGTMFEYLMPALFLRSFEDSLLTESLAGAVRIQQLYCRGKKVPWGISEAAHSARDGERNYQYRAFGVPVMGVKRMEPGDLVIAPYASILALLVDPRGATANLRHMAERGWLGDYGFFESIDYTGHQPEIVRAFMAHHEGMAFTALANALLDNPIQRRFHADPLVQAIELLLQERLPVIIEEQESEEGPIPAPDETFPEIAVEQEF